MFGYLNLDDPTKIGDTEAQVANNCRVDRGYLEFADWNVTDKTHNREAYDGLIKYYLNETFYPYPRPTAIRRDGNGKVSDRPGCPDAIQYSAGIGVAFTPGVPPPPSCGLSGGTYQYVVTLFDSIFGEEGVPTPIMTVSVPSATVGSMAITGFPNPSTSWPTKTLFWRVYRRDAGSESFLRTDLGGPGYNGLPMGTAVFYDTTPTANLEEMCTSFDSYMPQELAYLCCVKFAEKLFLASDNKVYFSKSGQLGAFPTEFIFEFDNSAMVLLVINEVLVIVTEEEKIFQLYGNDESDYVLKEILAPETFVEFFANTVKNSALVGLGEFYSFVIGGAPKNFKMITSLAEFLGTGISNLSEKISRYFPLMQFDFGVLGPTEYLGCETKFYQNRFFVLKHGTYNGFAYTNSNDLWQYTKVRKNLIFDVGKGFLTGDSSSTFSYKTKRFGTPSEIKQIREVFVEAEGTVTVNFIAEDGTTTTQAISSISRGNFRFKVKPYRSHYFEFEFIGNSNAKVYAFGVLE